MSQAQKLHSNTVRLSYEMTQIRASNIFYHFYSLISLEIKASNILKWSRSLKWFFTQKRINTFIDTIGH